MYLFSFVCSVLNRPRRTSVQFHRQARTAKVLKHRAILWGGTALVCLRHAIAFADIGSL